MRAGGVPRFGNTKFAVYLRNAHANSQGWLWLGLPTKAVSVGTDCNFHALGAIIALPVQTNGLGSATTPLPIPPAKNLIGIEVFVQYGIVDPKGCFQNLVNLSDVTRVLVGL